MPLKSSSSDASRRNRAIAGASLALLLALVRLAAPAPGHSQAVELTLSDGVGALKVGLAFTWDRAASLVDTQRSGLESRITFTVRLYQRRAGLFPLGRDRMIAEKVVVHSAFWDFLDERFVVEGPAGARTAYADGADLLAGFLAVRDLPLFEALRGTRGLYVTARARLEPVRLMPPLTLVTLVGTAATLTTPWARKDVP
jgi:hypothetical protein